MGRRKSRKIFKDLNLDILIPPELGNPYLNSDICSKA
jgi:hypothetical protein